MKTTYEWCYETRDGEDITDTDFQDKLSDFNEADKTSFLCLVRNEGDENEGLDNRSYAYVENGVLPEYFEEGGKVPERFAKELAKSLS